MQIVPSSLSSSYFPSPSSFLSFLSSKRPVDFLKTPFQCPSRAMLLRRSFCELLPPRFFGPGILSRVGVCGASQAVDLFSSICPEIVVRDARMDDCWEVADTHCSSFFPNYTFPIDLVLRINRFIALLSGFSIASGCMKTCLVAVTGSSGDDAKLYIGSDDMNIGRFEGKFNLSREYVAGILTVDTMADYLPRKGPLRQKRKGIAYISNVAVREADRRRGIAKLLLAKAEARALSWGCRSIALHCDANNAAAIRLYKGQGYKAIILPENASRPQPQTSPNHYFQFMMKLLTSTANFAEPGII